MVYVLNFDNHCYRCLLSSVVLLDDVHMTSFACVYSELKQRLIEVWCRLEQSTVDGATENAGVENAGVSRMERQREIIFPQCTGQTHRSTDPPTHRSRESFTTIGRYAPRATRPNNGHGHHQLWTKYVVHIMLHKNVRTLFIQKIVESVLRIRSMINTAIMVNKPNSSNNRLLGNRGWRPIPREENALYSRSRGIPAAVSPAPDTPAGWRVVVLPAPAVLPRFSRGILPLPLPCKTLLQTSCSEGV